MNAEERSNTNPFDFRQAFRSVFTGAGGFDAIIGNPPYGADFSPSQKSYLFERYPLLRGQPESYEYFLHRLITQLTTGGIGGNIVPTNFIESDRANGLRNQLLVETQILSIQNFRYNPWNNNASEPLVIIVRKSVEQSERGTLVTHPETPSDFKSEAGYRLMKQSDWLETPGRRFILRAEYSLLQKIEDLHPRLVDDFEVTQGIIVYKTREEGTKNLHIADQPAGETWVKLLDTHSSVGRYTLEWGRKYLNYGDWLWCPRESRFFTSPKLVFVRLRNKSLRRKLVATFDDEQFFNRDNFNDIIARSGKGDLKHLLGIFNSNVANYWYKAHFDNVNINPSQVRQIPVPHRREDLPISALVETVLALHKRLSSEKLPQRFEQIQREIDATDRQIDQLVYQLYELTDEEIAIVEAATMVR